MEIREIPLRDLDPAAWHSNEMSDAMLGHLAGSVGTFGLVVPLVVRPLGTKFEVLSGNQRLVVLAEQGVATVPSVVVDADDPRARLLAQALNTIHGQDDLGRRALLVRDLLDAMPLDEVAAILPDAPPMLQDFAETAATTGPTVMDALNAFERARQARLYRRSFALAEQDWEPVEEAITRALPRVSGTEEPNRKGLALRAICLDWLAIQDAHPP